jgi:hypothetical protein
MEDIKRKYTSPAESTSIEINERVWQEKIKELFAIGLDSDDVYAYHGTSVGAIKFLAQHGKLPNTGSHSDFFYVPADTKDWEEDVKFYAAWSAERYALLERLPFTPSDMHTFMYMYDDSEMFDKFVKEAATYGLTRNQLLTWMDEIKKSNKGVIITLSRQLVKDYQETRSLDDEGSVAAVLDIKYITGIEPCGQVEWDELKKIISMPDEQTKK